MRKYLEYQFTHSMHGVIARCSMDHDAFARWLNTEITENSKDLSLILTEIERCKQAFPNQYQAVFEGREYTLILDSDEVIVKANNLEVVNYVKKFAKCAKKCISI